jgi:uncharacterized membrane protein YjgN (DUF898 family)
MSAVSFAEPWQTTICEPTAPAVRPPVDRVAFVGDQAAYWRLMIRGTLLEAVTLGIYRFWLFTDMRRFLWANTTIDGESLEYTGTPTELLLGFLMAIGILIPIYGMLFVGTLELGMISQYSSMLGLVALAFFGQYATYRARRYRLTRTLLRGVRFHQTGSGWLYALRATGWTMLNTLTIGLTYPWALASLERFKMRHTFYGEVGGKFVGAGWRLFFRGIPIWLAIVVPFVAGPVAGGMMLDWPAIGRALKLGKGSNPEAVGAALLASKNFALGAGLVTAGLVMAFWMWVILYPAFEAIIMRWWLSGLRLGNATVTSDLRKRRYYGAYVLYFLIVVGIVFAMGMVAASVQSAATAMKIDFTAVFSPDAATAAVVALYVAFILTAWAIFQVVVKFRLWQVAAQSMTVTNLSSLEDVRASEAQSSALGEGLADALLGATAI